MSNLELYGNVGLVPFLIPLYGNPPAKVLSKSPTSPSRPSSLDLPAPVASAEVAGLPVLAVSKAAEGLILRSQQDIPNHPTLQWNSNGTLQWHVAMARCNGTLQWNSNGTAMEL